jgi:hypothetical protein
MMILALGLALLPAARGTAESPSKFGKDKPLATAQHDRGLVVDVLEVKRDSNKKLLTVRWRYRNPTDKTVVVLAQSGPFRQFGGRPIDHFVRDIYYLEGDKENGEKTYRHSIVRDTGRKLWASPRIGLAKVALKPGQEVVFWVKFSVPVTNADKISLHLPDMEPIENLPIQ